jgi:hypothetical protein
MVDTVRSQPCWQPSCPNACASGHRLERYTHAAWCSSWLSTSAGADVGVQRRAMQARGCLSALPDRARVRARCRLRTARSRCSQTAAAPARSCWRAATARTWARGPSSCASHQATPAPAAPRGLARRAAACGAGRAARAARPRARPARPARASAARQRPPQGVGQGSMSAPAVLSRVGVGQHTSACRAP